MHTLQAFKDFETGHYLFCRHKVQLPRELSTPEAARICKQWARTHCSFWNCRVDNIMGTMYHSWMDRDHDCYDRYTFHFMFKKDAALFKLRLG